jgi:hypothetical protein
VKAIPNARTIEWRMHEGTEHLIIREQPFEGAFEKLLPTLSPGEKAQILKWVVQELGDSFPAIDTRPDVCGGEP